MSLPRVEFTALVVIIEECEALNRFEQPFDLFMGDGFSDGDMKVVNESRDDALQIRWQYTKKRLGKEEAIHFTHEITDQLFLILPHCLDRSRQCMLVLFGFLVQLVHRAH